MNDTITVPDEILDDLSIREADTKAVLDHIGGKPLDPAVAARVHVRAKKITERVYQQFGELNVVVDLIHEGRDEE